MEPEQNSYSAYAYAAEWKAIAIAENDMPGLMIDCICFSGPYLFGSREDC